MRLKLYQIAGQDVYAFECRKNGNDIAKEAGFRFDRHGEYFDEMCWFTLDKKRAAKLARFIQDEETRDALADLLPKRKKIDPADLPRVTFQQSQLIHEAVRLVDGSAEKGWSKYDADFGHAMCERDHLTPNMVYACRSLVRKYWRQLPQELYEEIFPDFNEWPKAMQKQNAHRLQGVLGL